MRRVSDPCLPLNPSDGWLFKPKRVRVSCRTRASASSTRFGPLPDSAPANPLRVRPLYFYPQHDGYCCGSQTGMSMVCDIPLMVLSSWFYLSLANSFLGPLLPIDHHQLIVTNRAQALRLLCNLPLLRSLDQRRNGGRIDDG